MGRSDWVDLPGGGSHLLMVDRDSAATAALIAEWIEDADLDAGLTAG